MNVFDNSRKVRANTKDEILLQNAFGRRMTILKASSI